MAIKVSFPIGTSDIKVNGLHQWDYGQVLEIECVEIGSEIVEVHFACQGMSEAIVRPCTFANGVGTVIIPDRCLEQASNITAWVYRIVKDVADDGTEIVIQGHTVKTITLPVIARTRPSKSYDNISSGDIDKYKEALVEINEAVNALKEGNVTVANAINATEATHATDAVNAKNAAYATTAGNATTAGHATSADSATTADSAKNATFATSAGSATTAGSADKASRVSVSSYLSCEITGGYSLAPDNMNALDIYLVVYQDNTNGFNSGIFCRTSAVNGVYHCTVGLYDLLYLHSDAGTETITLTSDSIESANINGTLKFYKLGGISG